MGANTSALLSEEIDEISREENLSQAQVKRLYNRFQKLDRNQSGTLDPNDLLMIPEFAMNPLHARLIHVFKNVNFRQFVANVSAFSGHAHPNAKADFTFRIYDVDADGYISPADLRAILASLVGDNMPPDTLETIIQKVITDADADGDGRISRSEFTDAFNIPDVLSRLTVAM